MIEFKKVYKQNISLYSLTEKTYNLYKSIKLKYKKILKLNNVEEIYNFIVNLILYNDYISNNNSFGFCLFSLNKIKLDDIKVTSLDAQTLRIASYDISYEQTNYLIEEYLKYCNLCVTYTKKIFKILSNNIQVFSKLIDYVLYLEDDINYNPNLIRLIVKSINFMFYNVDNNKLNELIKFLLSDSSKITYYFYKYLDLDELYFKLNDENKINLSKVILDKIKSENFFSNDSSMLGTNSYAKYYYIIKYIHGGEEYINKIINAEFNQENLKASEFLSNKCFRYYIQLKNCLTKQDLYHKIVRTDNVNNDDLVVRIYNKLYEHARNSVCSNEDMYIISRYFETADFDIKFNDFIKNYRILK